VYLLKEGVRIFFNNDDEIRFRKGVWNFNEAIIRLHGQEEPVKRFFIRVIDELFKNDRVDLQQIAGEQNVGNEQLRSYVEIVENIRTQGFLYSESDKEVTRIVMALLGGTMSGFEKFIYEAKPVLLVSDNEYAKEAAKLIARQIKLPLDILSNETFTGLAGLDLTTKTEAVDYLKASERYRDQFSLYSCVLVSLTAPHISLMRNLNRILIELEKPMILGFMDGPFMTLLSTVVTQTGCFECFEQRMLARLQDNVVYQKFVAFTRAHVQDKDAGHQSVIFTPPSHILTAAVITEGFLYATFNMMRLAGRIINIYLPVLEIQVQDLLRVPYCPACGFISKGQMNEMYTSSRHIVNEMLSKIELVND
jgi:thiazole/oxazole-forming peptide maturase SagC family component